MSSVAPSPRAVRRLRLHALALRLAAFAILWIAAALPAAAKTDWEPVSPADLAATRSPNSPEADSEVLFSHVTLDYAHSTTVRRNHIRAKIYTTRGVDHASVFSIEYTKYTPAYEIAARIVRPDGTVTELTKNDFRESTAYKYLGYDGKRISFTFPNLQPGDLIEYRWTEDFDRWAYASYYILYCQLAEVPVREFVFEIKGSRADYDVSWFNCKPERMDPKSRKLVIRDLPPLIEEPFMPPGTETQSWILMVFTANILRFKSDEAAWEYLGEYVAEEFRLHAAPSRGVRAKTAELIAGAADDEEKVARCYRYVQAAIKNLDYDESPALAAAKKNRADAQREPSAAQTLERGYGNSSDIANLFAALVNAAGFTTRPAMSGNREDILNIRIPKGWVLARRETVLVKLGDRWACCTPGDPLVPWGLLRTNDAGALLYVCDEKKCWWSTAPVSSPAQTETLRTGRFTLDGEGNLDGTVTLQLTGHRALRARSAARNQPDEEIQKTIRDQVTKRLATAEVSEIKWENLEDPNRPLAIHYNVHVPAYAESLGSRLAFPINFFVANNPEMLTAETRRHPIFFDFAETERDDIEIVVPSDFTLDAPSSPAPVGAADDIIHASYGLNYHPKTHTLNYRREYVLGLNGMITFQAQSYGALRPVLTRIHRSDMHRLIVKPKASKAAPAATQPSTGTPAPESP